MNEIGLVYCNSVVTQIKLFERLIQLFKKKFDR